MTEKPPPSSDIVRKDFAPVNGLNLYFEIHGAGRPLVLLHGGLGGAGVMFGDLIPRLADGRQVIGVDLQAHAHTADIDRPFSWEGFAEDIAGLIRYLGLERADLMGYSLGGGVALRTALSHPEVTRRLVLVSAPCRRRGWYPEVLEGMAAMTAEAAGGMAGSPLHAAYVRVAPRPEDWPVLVAKTGELLQREYDWCGELAGIRMPVMIVVGDADSIPPAHAVEMFALLGGGKGDAGWDGSRRPESRLAILPGTTHYNSFASPLLAPAVISFLDEPA